MDTFRKWLNKPKADDKSLLARFYHADRLLTAVASELDSFDGRAEPDRCSRLVMRLRQGQDKVLAITSLIMEELLGEDRDPRAFRAKFPEEVLQENLAGQLWFGAECLAAGSSIMNREQESKEMRPLAQAVTKSLGNVRSLLRDQCLRNNVPNSKTLHLDINDSATEQLYESLKIFDRLFAEFELRYVSAMVQVKTKQEYEMQELICVLFSETLQRAINIGLVEQEKVDAFDPALMFSIPRLAIIAGLVVYPKGPLNMDMPTEQFSEMFRPFRTLLIRIRDLLRTLNKNELYQLEVLLCTNGDLHLNPASIIGMSTNEAPSRDANCRNNSNSTTNCDPHDVVADGDAHDDATSGRQTFQSTNEPRIENGDLPSRYATRSPSISSVSVDGSIPSTSWSRPPMAVSTAETEKTPSQAPSTTSSPLVTPSSSPSPSPTPSHSIASESSVASTSTTSAADDWSDDEDEDEDAIGQRESDSDDLSKMLDIIANTDCASGYLISNTNFGNLLQPQEVPLTDNFIASEDEFGGATGVPDSDVPTTSTVVGLPTGKLRQLHLHDSSEESEQMTIKASSSAIANTLAETQNSIENNHSDTPAPFSGSDSSCSSSSGSCRNHTHSEGIMDASGMNNNNNISAAKRQRSNSDDSYIQSTNQVDEDDKTHYHRPHHHHHHHHYHHHHHRRHRHNHGVQHESSHDGQAPGTSRRRHSHHHHHHPPQPSRSRSYHSKLRRCIPAASAVSNADQLDALVNSECDSVSATMKTRTTHPDASSVDMSTSSSLSDGDAVPESTLSTKAVWRTKFRSTESLLHRLFVCIAGVADQLQTNFAADLRQILRSVFLMNMSMVQEELDIPEKQKDSELFEFRASENDVIQSSAGSNQSIYSAEEVNPELEVFNNNISNSQSNNNTNNNNNINNNRHSTGSTTMQRVHTIDLGVNDSTTIDATPTGRNQIGRSRSLGDQENNDVTPMATNNRQSYVNGRQLSSPPRQRETVVVSHQRQQRNRNNSVGSNSYTSSSSSSSETNSPISDRMANAQSNNNNNGRVHLTSTPPTASGAATANSVRLSPPAWIPDDKAPRCMSCSTSFTAFRRRHHCRNCGGVFCNVCSNASAPLPKYGLTKAVRVCRKCYVDEVRVGVATSPNANRSAAVVSPQQVHVGAAIAGPGGGGVM